MSKVTKRIIIISVVSLIVVLSLVYPFFLIGERVALGFERLTPDYEMKDISSLLEKDELTKEYYQLLYYQTGLTNLAIDQMLLSNEGKEQILKIQNCFFKDYEIDDDNFAIFSHYYEIEGVYPIAPLQNGDIIVSSSTEFSWWTMGHCAMVVDAERGLIVEVNGYGDTASRNSLNSIRSRGNFMVLRPNIEGEDVDRIIDYTLNNLLGVKYDATIGVLSRKYNDDIKYSQCAHIFWYAFYKFGYDIDSNGGTVVTPQNVAESQYFDVVQVSGFNPYTLWSD